jgi:hypothetical protein
MITALTLAFGAALFTVLGFRDLFGETFNITYMAATIEVGKIICVSAIYQFRNILGWWIKSALFALIIAAMVVTSMGVYGFLSGSYQKDSLYITQNEARLTILEKRKTVLEGRLDGMDVQIASVPETYVTKRMELMDKFAPERDRVMSEIDKMEENKLTLTLERIDSESEFGAILLLARSIEGIEPDKAMLYFIFLVIFIFDPMAITLTYTANVGYYNANNTRREEEEEVPTVVEHTEPQDNTDVMNRLNEVMETVDGDREEGVERWEGVMDTLKQVSEDLVNIRNQKPTDARADVVESMRNQTT